MCPAGPAPGFDQGNDLAGCRVGAEAGTRTRIGCPTRPSNVRVYQFHHFGSVRDYREGFKRLSMHEACVRIGPSPSVQRTQCPILGKKYGHTDWGV